MKDSPYNNYLILGTVIIFAFILTGIIIFFSEHRNSDNSIKTQNPLLLGNIQSSQANTYTEPVCGISFNHPALWKQSAAKLPLPQPPLSQVIFDEPGKNSLFSFVCYDGSKYTFDQFITDSGSDFKKESLTVGGLSWTRAGNYIYTTQNNKLYILQMFFTKYDMEPEIQYENTFMDILKSVRFN